MKLTAGCETHFGEVLTNDLSAGHATCLIPFSSNTLLLRRALSARLAVESAGTKFPQVLTVETSKNAAVFVSPVRRIRQKVIGHGIGSNCARFRPHRLFSLLHKPSRQHGGSIFFDPLIKKHANLLAKIRSVAQARELIALQRSAGCRKKEFPRWLGIVPGHSSLLLGQGGHDNRKVIIVNDDNKVKACGKVWKFAADASGLTWRACSACPGDYEDPDRTTENERQDDDEELSLIEKTEMNKIPEPNSSEKYEE